MSFMHDNSMNLMKWFRYKYLRNMKGCSILDVGSKVFGKQESYKTLFNEYQYVGMDIEEGPNVDIVGYDLLNKYDVVISGQVMEHVERPWEWLCQLTKYFHKYICIISPHTFPEHRFPIDCYRFLPDGIRALFNYANILPLEIRKQSMDTIGVGTHKI